MSIGKSKKYRGTICLNCEYPLDISDKFCSNCGQINSTKRLTIKEFINEFFANFYAYDSKLNNTIRSLFTKPGCMALEYVRGKKNSYANPFRFYLSVSLIYFILVAFMMQWNEKNVIKINPVPSNKMEEINFNVANQTNDSILAINETILDKKQKKDSLKILVAKLNSKNLIVKNIEKLSIFETFTLIEPDYEEDKALLELGIPITKWNKKLYKKSKDLSTLFDSSNPDKLNQFFQFLISKLPLLLFISIPFLTLCFSLVYISSEFNYVENLVFVFSNMAFLFILLLINEIQEIFTDASYKKLIFIGYSFYFYKSLRNFYQQKRWKTILKFVILGILLSIASSFTFIFIIIISFFLY